MTNPTKSDEIDWSVCTWKGSRRLQHQEFHALPFARKLEIIEEMNDFGKQWRQARDASQRRQVRMVHEET